MSTFLTSLGGKLAERWVATLLLPSAGFLLAVYCALLLGHRNAFDAVMLDRESAEFIERYATASHTALTVVVILLLAMAAGFIAQVSGQFMVAVWIGRWRGPAAFLGRRLTGFRRRRAAAREAESGVDAVPGYLPQEPTWMADRFRLLRDRVAAQYHGLHATLVWPRLWILLPDSARAPVQAANTQFQAATVLSGWGLLYTLLGLVWFPSAIIGVVTIAVGWRRGRAATATLADLMESIVDTHLCQLATALNLTIGPAGITPELAARINDQLHKGA